MEIKVNRGDIIQSRSNVIVVSHFEESEKLEGVIASVDSALGGAVGQLISQGEIKGKFKEITIIHSLGKVAAGHVAIVGLGKKSDLTLEKVRVAAAEVARSLRLKSLENIDIAALGTGTNGISPESSGQAIAEGVLLGTYTFRKHMTKAAEYKEIKNFTVIEPDMNLVSRIEQGIHKGKIIAAAANLARDMVNEPSNFMTPTNMADSAQKLAQTYLLDVTVLDCDEIKRLGMGGLLGVAQGSQQPPKFIVLKYIGREVDDIDIAMVGKGITFDSGGISIKPSEGMGDMKGDMAGGASVIAAISAIAQLKAKVNVTAVVPATENLPSGTAYKPGDVLTAMNGKTMEIISTDAEGRLILADALSYSQKMGAKSIIDVATLTGACRVALGDFCTGVFGNDQGLVSKVIAAGAEAGEGMWQMPMNDEYKELIKSDVADLKNTGGRWAGAITAALFLGEFVEKTPWVHLDIAGTSDTDKERGYLVKGATGVPVRTLINLVLSLEK